MKNDIYVNVTNTNIITNLNENKSFEAKWNYDAIRLNEAHQNEWGKFTINGLRIHFLVGNIKTITCPWCACDPNLIIEDEPDCPLGKKRKFYMLCPRCKSKGPETIMTINDPSEEVLVHIKELIKHKYSERIKWDEKLNYEP